MELKFEQNLLLQYEPLCSNRTFMELKWVPTCRDTTHDPGSNRTFMELK